MHPPLIPAPIRHLSEHTALTGNTTAAAPKPRRTFRASFLIPAPVRSLSEMTIQRRAGAKAAAAEAPAVYACLDGDAEAHPANGIQAMIRRPESIVAAVGPVAVLAAMLILFDDHHGRRPGSSRHLRRYPGF
eukprot:tig00000403_g316.t1